MTQQMVVTQNADGSHSPAYSNEWPEGTRLEWHAGFAALQTGLRIEVRSRSSIVAGVRVDKPDSRPETYRISLKGPRVLNSTSGMTFREACVFLEGVCQAVAASKP